jgi:DNA-directed RNA polymerase specialized sigma24 family protein
MDPRPHLPTRNTATEKRVQKFLDFTFVPGDEALVARLPPAQQRVLLSEGTYATRAQEHGIPIGTVRSRLHRAREALVKLRESHAKNELPNVPTEGDPMN